MNCRHCHCRVLTVGEYVRIYMAAMGAPCPFMVGRWEADRIASRCLKCGAWRPLGPSNDAGPAAVEVRAAELAHEEDGWQIADWDEVRGWNDRLDTVISEAEGSVYVSDGLDEDGWHAGYLAHAIAHHAEEQMQAARDAVARLTDADFARMGLPTPGRAATDDGTTEGA